MGSADDSGGDFTGNQTWNLDQGTSVFQSAGFGLSQLLMGFTPDMSGGIGSPGGFAGAGAGGGYGGGGFAGAAGGPFSGMSQAPNSTLDAILAIISRSNQRNIGQNLGMGLLHMLTSDLSGMGPLGAIFGALLNFGGNAFLNKEPKLPIREGALDTRVINFKDAGFSYRAVEDSSELAYSRQRRLEWQNSSSFRAANAFAAGG